MDKTQKRQLESNDLGESVLNAFEKIQPYLTHILVAVLVLAVAYIGFKVYSASVKSKEALITEKIFSSVSRPADLEEIAQQAPAPLNAWAWNLAGNARLTEAVGKIPADRAGANDDLTQAENDFKAALNTHKDEAKQMAYFGLGRVYEQKVATTPEKAEDNVKTALDYYKKLTTQWSNSIYARQANLRIAALSSDGIVKMLSNYASYETQEPKEGERNDIPLDITAPNPEDVEQAAPAEEKPAEEAAPAEEKPAEEAAPAEEKPAEQAAPAEEKPAEQAAPAEEKPAEEAAPAEEKPAEEAAPAEEKPAEEAAPAEEKPAEEAAPAEEKPAEQAAPAEEKPAEQAAPAEEKPAEEAAPTEEKPAEQAAPAEEKPAEQAVPAEEKPAEQAAPAEEKPAEQAAPAEEKPAEQAAPAEEKPAEQAAPAEEKPAEEAAPAEEKPAEQAAPAEEKPAEQAK